MRTRATFTQPRRLLRRRQRGTLLAEVLVALLLGSMVMLAGARLLVHLRAGHVAHERRLQLEDEATRVLARLEKDLRRAGFCASGCDIPPPSIGEFPGEAMASCLIVYYDLNADGRLDVTDSGGESFGYRLRGGALETQRAVRDCRATQWEKITDERYVTVTRFHAGNLNGVYRLQLGLRSHDGGDAIEAVRLAAAENLR